MQKRLDVIQALNNLNKLKRIGPSLSAGVPGLLIESLAEHSYRVIYLCLIFSGVDKKIYLENLLKYAITHEWGECILGDMPLGSKSYLSYFDDPILLKQIFRNAEGKAKHSLIKDAGLNYHSLNDEEMKLFKFCDTFARVIELIDNKQMGQKHAWFDKMYRVQMNLLKQYDYPFVHELLEGVDKIYKRGYMENKYLTKETDKDLEKE